MISRKSYRVKMAQKAEKNFAKLPRNIQKFIWQKLLFFEQSENPLRYSKKLTGYSNAYRFRAGDYRIIFTPKENGQLVILLILKIGHRSEIY